MFASSCVFVPTYTHTGASSPQVWWIILHAAIRLLPCKDWHEADIILVGAGPAGQDFTQGVGTCWDQIVHHSASSATDTHRARHSFTINRHAVHHDSSSMFIKVTNHQSISKRHCKILLNRESHALRWVIWLYPDHRERRAVAS